MSASAQIQIRRRRSYAPTRWKNGGGITHEAIRMPAGADAYRWRVSVAEIAASGAFSDFSGYQRRMVLLGGAGLRLRFSNGEQTLLRHAGDLAAFDGALQTQCELLAGPCTDLNLVAANSLEIVETEVRRLAAPLTLRRQPGQTIVLFSIDGGVMVEQEAGESAELELWDLAVLSGAAGAAAIRPCADRPTTASVFLAKLSGY